MVLIGAVLAGCATADPAKSSTQAEPLKLGKAALPDLKGYNVAVVKPFDTSKAKDTDPSVGAQFAEDIARRLQYDFGKLFDQVTVGNPVGATNELIITGEITKYAPGDKALRGLLIGLGAASFNGNLCLQNGDDRLLEVPFDKLWAWGGLMGMSKGIEDMEITPPVRFSSTLMRFFTTLTR
jgi:hypothetical protein